ncbi:alpha/beta hydrolase [Pararhizobium capsulatum]|nr:alpha/beta hydrolase [Pararhizobium capsulatum]
MRLSTVHFVVCAFVSLLAAAWPVCAQDIGPFKDDLFSYGKVLDSADNGDFRVIDYDKPRDIWKRDLEPEHRVRRAYVSLGVRKMQANETLDVGGRPLDIGRVGNPDGAAFSVIFVHGRGGDRRLGMNDYNFGGNFNRLKNLAVENGGVYYAPTIRSFDRAGVADISGLIAYAQQHSPGRPIVLACASMGSFICWGITREVAAVSALKGMVIMGGPSDGTFPASAAYKAKLPIYFTHGTLDIVYPYQGQIDFYRSLKDKGYPTRFVLFNTGSHGTPVRMTDWRDVLNWIGVG